MNTMRNVEVANDENEDHVVLDDVDDTETRRPLPWYPSASRHNNGATSAGDDESALYHGPQSYRRMHPSQA